MTDDTVNDTSLADPPARSRRWPWVVALLILFAIAALALLAIRSVREAGDEQAGMRAQTLVLDERLQSLERGLEQMRESQQRLSQRLDSSSATNQVLREELLGMGERAGLLEDAVARLAQSRMSGESTLRLNEAEFLLSMGAERLSLYADTASAIQAFSLAEGALAGLDDPALATLRQTLAQELIQLRELPPDPRPRLRAELAALAGQLSALPASREDTIALAKPEDSRFRQLLGQVITVRRVDPQASLLGPSQRQAALAAISLQLDLAQAALAKPDEAAFHAALDRITQATPGLFDAEADVVTRWSARLASLRQARLSPDLPVLGATLRELRGVRAIRHAGAGEALRLPPPEPAPDATDTAPQMQATPAADTSITPQDVAVDVEPEPAIEQDTTENALPESDEVTGSDEITDESLPELEVEPVPGARP